MPQSLILNLFDDSVPFVGNLIDNQITTDRSLTARIQSSLANGETVTLSATDGLGAVTVIGSGTVTDGLATIEVVNAALYNGQSIAASHGADDISNALHYTVDTNFVVERLTAVTGDQVVNGTDTGSQFWPQTVALLGGGYVTVWRDNDGGNHVSGQVYNADGTQHGTPFSLGQSTGSLGVAPLANGGFAVAYGYPTVVLKTFDLDGNASAAIQLSNNGLTAPANQVSYAQEAGLTLLADGSLALSFFGGLSNGGGDRVFYQHLDATGTPDAAPVAFGAPGVSRSHLSAMPDGNVLLEFARLDANYPYHSQVFTKVLSPTGAEISSQVINWPDQTSVILDSTAEVLPDGGWVVAWSAIHGDTFTDGGPVDGVFFQRYDHNGAAVGGIQRASNINIVNDHFSPKVQALPGGGFIVAFAERGGDSSAEGFMAQVYDADGAKVGGLVRLNEGQQGRQNEGSIALLTNGTLVASFQTDAVNSPYDIYQRLFHLSVAKPTITHADLTASAQEKAATAPDHDTADISATGTIGFNDPNLAHVHTISVVPNGTGYLGDFDAGLQSGDNLDGNREVIWNFTGTDADLNSLADGEVRVQTYVVTIADNEGGSVSRTVTVTLTGSNDVPVVGVTSDIGATLVEKASDAAPGISSATGTLVATDVDTGDSLTWSIVGGVLQGTYGSIALNVDGTWVYTLDNNRTATQALNDGDSVNDTFTARVSDGIASADQLLTFTVQGRDEIFVSSAPGASVTGSVFGDSITGSTGDEFLSGQAGNDKLFGLDGADTLLGDSGNDALDGGNGNDSLRGGIDNDTLKGGDGDDTLTGDAGNDMVYGDAGNDVLNGGAGIDTLDYSMSGTGVSVNLATGAVSGGLAAGDVISGFENVLGGVGDDRLSGSSVANLLSGGDGNDTIAGRAGADTLDGGRGIDTLDYSTSAAGVSVNLSTGAASGGEAAGDVISGFENVQGGLADDNLTGSGDANRLIGGGGNDTLIGLAGADTLNGGTGADQMIGGADNDLYVVDNANDIIVEDAGGGTADIVTASVSFTLAADDDIELLATVSSTAVTAIDLTGNDLSQTITGNAGVNRLFGLGGADSILGLDGNDSLYGGSGNDTLNGGTGSDTMDGGAGNDLFYVDSATDVVVETAGNGTADRLLASVSYVLAAGADIEFLSTTSAASVAAINLTGNELSQALYGNAGANVLSGLGGNDSIFGGDGDDTLIGGTGKDVLYGGNGADVFIFDTALSASSNVDILSNYVVADDVIHLDHLIFTGLAAGALSASAFASGTGTSAINASQHIIYQTTTGNLYFDVDGVGGTASVLFAKVGANLAGFGADEFFVV